MTTVQAIAQKVKTLPEEAQREVLDFAEFLAAKSRATDLRTVDESWSAFSLSSAMRGMEDELTPYEASDIKEPFQ